MYHPIITKLDSAAIELHPIFPEESKRMFVTIGKIQQHFFDKSVKKRFFDAQYCWALGHIGILYQLIRWFRLKEPETELI